ncbi:hypothetical protein B0T24DRAFT_589249 [Lasiosphaeria ovina]|uniref:F-box domain-containing protein n=1 Tax=Lasiosphaeria ovina TaxID=92902 RepID=A0AAE0TYZ2_9PEZI|nr:hypothetical protein B0T24DRAFT_589249 [Lasiosphaeria ovina]
MAITEIMLVLILAALSLPVLVWAFRREQWTDRPPKPPFTTQPGQILKAVTVELISHPKGHHPNLEGLPAEVMLHITGYLEPCWRATLALASRTTLFKLGSQTLQVGPFYDQKYKLLSSLALDGKYLPEILCRYCRIFHSAESAPESCKLRHHAHQIWPHPRLPWNLVKAVMECDRKGITSFGPKRLASQVRVDVLGMRLHVYHDFRVVGEHLLVRIQKLVRPLTRGDSASIVARVATHTRAFYSGNYGHIQRDAVCKDCHCIVYDDLPFIDDLFPSVSSYPICPNCPPLSPRFIPFDDKEVMTKKGGIQGPVFRVDF